MPKRTNAYDHMAGALPAVTALDASISPHPQETRQWELMLVTSGQGTLLSSRPDTQVNPGSLLVARQGDWFAIDSEPDLQMLCCRDGEHTSQLIPPALRESPSITFLRGRASAASQPDGLQVLQIGEAACERVASLMHQIQSLRQTSPLAAAGAFLMLLGELESVLATGHRKQVRAAAALPQVVLSSLEFLHGQLAHDWTLEELAQSAGGVDPSYLSRLFRQHCGEPPIAYLSRRRAFVAGLLLRVTEDPVSAVGARIGWDDPNYFARRFRQLMGASPSNYRLKHGRIRAGIPG